MLKVVQATTADKKDWNEFLSLSNSISHHAYRWEWSEIIEKTFKHTAHYFLVKDSKDSIQGILPLFHVKSILFGSALISVPYLNAGGIIASTKEAFDLLLEHADKLKNDLNVKYCELRHTSEQSWYPQSATLRTHKISMLLEINNTAEEIFSSFKPKLRSQIRRPSKSGITSMIQSGDDNFQKSLNGFYNVFSNHMRDLGTPVFPKSLFDNACRAFEGNAKIITAWHLKECVAAGITIESDKRVEIP